MAQHTALTGDEYALNLVAGTPIAKHSHCDTNQNLAQSFRASWDERRFPT